MRNLYYIFILLSLNCHSQAPGGVTANLQGWYKANAGLTFVGSVISQWADQSGNTRHGTQGTNARRPAENTTGFNYNSTILFDGADDFFSVGTDLMATGTTGVSVIAVARRTSTAGDTWGAIILGQSNTSTWAGGGYGITALNAGNTAFGFWIRQWDANFVSYANSLLVPTLMTGVWNGTTANAVQYFHNGTSIGTDAYTPGTVGDNGATFLGSATGTGTEYCFNGDIAEIIVYNTGISTANANRINSYLALKYGLVKSGDYVNSSSTTIYSNAAPYTSNIIGIGRDDNSVLIQKQSKQLDDSTRIYISTLAATNGANAGTFSGNNQFVMMGANTGKLSGIGSEKPGSIYKRLEREWKVTNTGFTSTFNLDVKLNAIAIPGTVSTSDLRLLVDADGDFSDATVYSAADGLVFTYTNPLITITGINNTMIPSGSTRYITIASIAASTPLPVELYDFKVFTCDPKICLSWQTAVEKNNNYFEIEHSIDGITWQNKGMIKGAGNSSRPLEYSSSDPSPVNGTSYYRLRQVDFGGETSFSKIIPINFMDHEDREIVLSPNPCDEELVIDATSQNWQYLEISNTLGEILPCKIETMGGESPKIRVETSYLSNGIYYLQFIGAAPNSQSKNLKFVVLH